jgi:hypothetical protein
MERFPGPAVEVAPVSFGTEMTELRQLPEEPLLPYYRRVLALMSRVGAKDKHRPTRGATPTPTLASLSSLESAMLDTILRAFIRGIADEEVKHAVLRHMVSPD